MEVTGSKDIQVVCHCVGSITFFMSLLGGYIDRSWLRTIVVSQVAYDLIPHTSFTKMASLLNFSKAMQGMGLDGLDVNANNGRNAKEQILAKLGDAVGAMRTWPIGGEDCESEECHRITFLYGLLWKHVNMNKPTHETLGESFGFANARGLEQLMRCINNINPVCDSTREKDPNKPMYNQMKNLSMPIRFISGALNYCFDPKSTAHSVQVARQVQPLSDRVVIPGYGHIDVFMGHNAAKDSYHHFESFLDKHAKFTLSKADADAIDQRHFNFAAKGSCCTVL